MSNPNQPGGGWPPGAPPGGPAGYPQQQQQQGYPQQAAPMVAQGYAPQAAPGGGQLEITTGFFFLAWILFLITPTIEINRQPQKRAWGTHLIDLPPGQYELTVSFRYLFIERCGAATAHVPIYPGQATVVKYEAPWFMFSAGTMTIQGNRPMMGQPQLMG